MLPILLQEVQRGGLMSLTVWLKEGHTVAVIARSVEGFQERTGVDVDLVAVPEGEAHDALIAGQRRPDVVTVPYWYKTELVARGVLRPLDDVLPPDEVDWERFAAVAVEALMQDGLHWGVPHTLTGGMLSFRQDLFDAAGIDPPTTLDDVTSAARSLQRRTSAQHGLVARASAEFSSLETYAGWAWAKGARILPESGNADPREVARGVSDLVAALRVAGPSDLTSRDYGEVGALVAQGHAAQLFDTSAWGFFLEDHRQSAVAGRMGYTTIAGPAAPAQFLYAEGLGITSWSRSPEEAAAFITWRHSEETTRAEVEEVGRLDLPRNDLWEASWYREIVRRRSLERYMEVVRRSWQEADAGHLTHRADFVHAARMLMGPLAHAVRRQDADLVTAISESLQPDCPERRSP
jgi:ABC-type glycerol-3-phosphate transport system substrate-binding protein